MAVAHRMYASALLLAAREGGELGIVAQELADFLETSRQVPELDALLRNPELDRHVKLAALEELLAGGDEIVRNFLLLVVEKGRAAELEQIVAEFDRLVAAEEGRLAVELTTAVELSDEETGELLAQIERASGRKLEATRRVDPDLIGGLILQAGSLRVDASVRGRLNQLRHELRS